MSFGKAVRRWRSLRTTSCRPGDFRRDGEETSRGKRESDLKGEEETALMKHVKRRGTSDACARFS